MLHTSRTSIIAVTLQGGFGNHLLAYFAAVIFALKQTKSYKIQLLSNELPHDSNALRQDTRSALGKIAHPNWLATEEDLFAWQHHPYTAALKDAASYYAYDASEPFHYIHLTLISIPLLEYEQHRIHLRNALRMDPELWSIRTLQIGEIGEQDVVVSFRLGMGSAEVSPTVFSASGQHRLPFTYYEQALTDILASTDEPKRGRLIVCSDNFQDAYLRHFLDVYADAFSSIVLAQWDTLSQFACLIHAKTIVSSNSTFSVMASILSDAPTIYIPSFEPYGTIYHIDHRTDPDLFRVQSPRFKPISMP